MNRDPRRFLDVTSYNVRLYSALPCPHQPSTGVITQFRWLRWYCHPGATSSICHWTGYTSLSAYIWKMEEEKIQYKINWEIITRAPSCKNLNSTCYLCIQEKIAIQNFSPREHLLNRRSEIAVKCRHKSKFLLKTWKDKSKKLKKC